MKPLVCIKLGGSLITDKSKANHARMDIITQLAQELASFIEKNPDVPLILGTGAGSFGHHAATKYDLQTLQDSEYAYGFARIGMAAQELNGLVVQALLKSGVPAVAIHPSSFMTTDNGAVQSFEPTSLLGHLELGAVPVLHGDIVFDASKQSYIVPTEVVFDELIQALAKAEKSIGSVIYCSVVDGVLDSQNKVVPIINHQNYDAVSKNFYATEGFDVTGGMAQKVQEALKLTRLCSQIKIINGQQPGNLSRALANEPIGTTIED